MDNTNVSAVLAAEFATLGGVFVLVALLGYVICLWDLLPDLTETLHTRLDAAVYALGPAIVLLIAWVGISHPVSGWFFIAGALALRFAKKAVTDAATT